MKKNTFEKHGLVIDQERVLTYSKLSCPLDCRYCFVDELNTNQEKNVSYLSKEQIDLLYELPEEVTLIMLGCDTEFFQNREKSLEILEKLSNLDKDISTITKLPLPKKFIKKLLQISKKLEEKENIFTLSVSIPCLESAQLWEPKAPSPEKRIETLKMAHEAGIKTMVALRPLLPTVSEDELEKIIQQTNKYCIGYYSGPLYLKELDRELLRDISGADTKQIQPHWMPDGNKFYKVEKEGQMQFLEDCIEKYNKPIFEGAADGMKYLKSL